MSSQSKRAAADRGLAGDRNADFLGRLQSHHDPAQDARVAGRCAGSIAPGHPVAGPSADQERHGALRGIAQAIVTGQGIGLAQRQRGHRMTVHADDLAAAAKIAVRLLLLEQEIEPLAHHLGVPPVGVRVAGPQIGQEGQSRQGRIGLPVGALAEAGLAGGAVHREVVVALDGRSVLVPRDPAVPAAVVVLVAAQPVERALDGQLAGGTRADALRPRGAVGFEPRLIDLGYLRETLAARRDRPAPPVPSRRRASRGLGVARASGIGSPTPTECVQRSGTGRSPPAPFSAVRSRVSVRLGEFRDRRLGGLAPERS